MPKGREIGHNHLLTPIYHRLKFALRADSQGSESPLEKSKRKPLVYVGTVCRRDLYGAPRTCK